MEENWNNIDNSKRWSMSGDQFQEFGSVNYQIKMEYYMRRKSRFYFRSADGRKCSFDLSGETLSQIIGIKYGEMVNVEFK